MANSILARMAKPLAGLTVTIGDRREILSVTIEPGSDIHHQRCGKILSGLKNDAAMTTYTEMVLCSMGAKVLYPSDSE